jgi:hypothetical protein
LHISTKHDEPRFEIIADKDAIKPVEESKKSEAILEYQMAARLMGLDRLTRPTRVMMMTWFVSRFPAKTVAMSSTDDMDTQDSGVPASSAEKRKHLDLKRDLDDLPPTIKRARIQQDQEKEGDDKDVVCID